MSQTATIVKAKKAPRPTRSHALQRRENIVSYLFLVPALIFFLGFVIGPMVMGFVTSFFRYTMNDAEFAFIGLDNYVTLFQDAIFIKSLKNTILIVVTSVPLVAAFSLWVGATIYEKKPALRSLFRAIFYLPVVTGTVAVVVVWKWMFDPYTGVFNWLLKSIGAITQPIQWLGDGNIAIWCILMILFTTSVGQPIVLYVAALGNVDGSLVEAAEVDGATRLQIFWHIKWAAIKPTTLYVLVITTINSFQCFALIQLLTEGGPNFKTSTIMYYLYHNAFKLYDFGYANAMGIVLAVIIAVLSFAQFRLMNSDD